MKDTKIAFLALIAITAMVGALWFTNHSVTPNEATWEDVQNFDLKTECSAPMQLHSPKTDRSVERKELRAALNLAIESLPARFRIPFVMRDVEGFAYEEIAKMLKLPKGTVKSRINRARLRFKEYMEENCEEVLRFET